MPLDGQSFDAILCNQCLHHLDTPGNNFVNQRKFFNNAKNYLNDEGQIIVNTISHEQMEHGVWWAELIKPAINKMKPRFASEIEFRDILQEADFYIHEVITPVDEIIQAGGYFDPESLHNPEFRNGDSHFSLLDSSELELALAKLRQLQREDQATNYIKDKDSARQRVGQFSVLSIRKRLQKN